ncbi:FHA domain-containing protein [Endozoicomonas gorgoniicola]|uniref:FHA domain-containing protein n=1 Tax=Endozoicomonas gorgoniicola TaxID=1234144 RepID=A0ABT3MP51_9GAMM|nr:FHA domain-containing protein [Endozoicomonas gorgoniicola]MCW7551145.1 FHA domain-containing protein [Endozoicomonas gorgoniicola]
MQFMIISVPEGEQVASLSHSLNAEELLIGQSDSCQIRLPDRQNRVADQHARLTREDSLWYVENLSDLPLHINQVEVPVQARQRLLLSDGDILSCGDYQLAASDFSPWLGTTGLLDTPVLTVTEDQAPEQYALTPTSSVEEDEEALDDPFARKPASKDSQTENGNVDVSMSGADRPLTDLATATSLNLAPDQKPLIDILTEPDDLDNDWSIHRGLWYGKITQPQEPDESCLYSQGSRPVLTQIPRIYSQPPGSGDHATASPDTPATQQRSICKAMLSALDQAIEDFCPDQLAEQFRQSVTASSPVTDTQRTSRIRQHFRWQPDAPSDASPNADFLPNYQYYYQELMVSKRYRLLFLQRFRQALKEQEQLFRSNDDGT